ncbi:unnamed protein product [Sphenostylis stenocarpa]|uniref:Uncharacterized protein n=1 Tax=Sphenostylis stenocarpa TaxID=92480 RepID=A0AA86STZ9_9FABA|nr:unnamed protein product [Sphenostylis stenocarpa]
MSVMISSLGSITTFEDKLTITTLKDISCPINYKLFIPYVEDQVAQFSEVMGSSFDYKKIRVKLGVASLDVVRKLQATLQKVNSRGLHWLLPLPTLSLTFAHHHSVQGV